MFKLNTALLNGIARITINIKDYVFIRYILIKHYLMYKYETITYKLKSSIHKDQYDMIDECFNYDPTDKY